MSNDKARQAAALEHGIPIPPRKYRGSRCSKFPLDKMEVGDSYFVECASRKERVSAASAAHKYGKSHGQKHETRQVDGGIRVWRTA